MGKDQSLLANCTGHTEETQLCNIIERKLKATQAISKEESADTSPPIGGDAMQNLHINSKDLVSDRRFI